MLTLLSLSLEVLNSVVFMTLVWPCRELRLSDGDLLTMTRWLLWKIRMSNVAEICLSVCPSLCLFICVSIYVFIYLSIYLSINLSIHVNLYLSVYLDSSIYLSIYSSVYYLSTYLSIHLSVYLPIYLFFSIFIYLYFPTYLYNYCLSVYLCPHFSSIISSPSPAIWKIWDELVDGSVPTEIVLLDPVNGAALDSSEPLNEGTYSIFLAGDSTFHCTRGERRDCFLFLF